MLVGGTTMKVEFINPFVAAAAQVLKQEVNADIKKGQISIEESAFTSQDVTVMIGVTGEVHGIVLYGLSEKTAKNIVSTMLDETVPIFDKMAGSAIAEMGNVITGLASGGLEKAGYICDIAPPTLITGRGVMISTLNIKRLRIPLETSLGDLEISCALISNDAVQNHLKNKR